MEATTKEIINILKSTMFSINNEKDLQQQINDKLQKYFVVERECRLSNKDIIDFKIQDVGIEVKIKGNPKSILRQLKRYAEYNELKTIILFTNVAQGMYETLNGKDIYVVFIGDSLL